MRILNRDKIILISKPRSGSTSLRMALDAYTQPGDIACDTPFDCWHPHHTASKLQSVLAAKGLDFDSYFSFCTARNPYDLVVSYYFFFRPDVNGTYNYSEKYIADNLMAFEDWVRSGRIWDQTLKVLGPDLSTIGVKAFCYDEEGNQLVDRIYSLPEEIGEIEFELGKRLGDATFGVRHANKSTKPQNGYREFYTQETRRLVEQMFEMEFELFDYRF